MRVDTMTEPMIRRSDRGAMRMMECQSYLLHTVNAVLETLKMVILIRLKRHAEHLLRAPSRGIPLCNTMADQPNDGRSAYEHIAACLGAARCSGIDRGCR